MPFDTLHTLGFKKSDELERVTYDPRVVGRDLTTFLHRSIGADDLVALMRLEMSLSSLRFTRRPSQFDVFLLSGAEWQKRFLEGLADDVERMYEGCYGAPEERGIFWEMVWRRREMRLLDTLRGLRVGGTMNRRGDSLITLATATDGVAVIDTNSFTPALDRAARRCRRRLVRSRSG